MSLTRRSNNSCVASSYDARQAILRRSAYIATRHFLANALHAATGIYVPLGRHTEPDESTMLHASRHPVAAAASSTPTPAKFPRVIRLFLPVLCAGRALLHNNAAFPCIVSAIGDFVHGLQSGHHQLPANVEVTILLDPFAHADLIGDLEAGRIAVGRSLTRAVSGLVGFTVLYRKGETGWVSQSMRVKANTTIRGLGELLGVCIGQNDSGSHRLVYTLKCEGSSEAVPLSPDDTLLTAGVTEDSVLSLLSPGSELPDMSMSQAERTTFERFKGEAIMGDTEAGKEKLPSDAGSAE